MKDFRNLRVKKGTFYVSSKEPLQGYKEVTYIDKKTNKEKMVYHLELGSITGKLTKLDIYNGTYGNSLRIYMDDDAHINVIDVPLNNPYGSISDYVKSVVQVLGNLVPQEEYTLFVNKTHKNNKGIPYKNLVFLKVIDDEKKVVEWSIHPKDFPDIEVETDPLGEKTYDKKKRDSFIKDKLVEGMKTFSDRSALMSEDKHEKVEEVVKTDDFNELPF